MKTNDMVRCEDFPCKDINLNGYIIPSIEVSPGSISIIMISESTPPSPLDYFYAGGNPSYAQTTLTAFNDAGIQAASIHDLLKTGVYFTTAVKCPKMNYGIDTDTAKTCSKLLESELQLFPNARVYMLMGDVAIKAVNFIALRNGMPRVIPNGPTYKMRGQQYYYGNIRVFPSYLQVGPSFNIEKSKRRMIAEDIASAFAFVKL